MLKKCVIGCMVALLSCCTSTQSHQEVSPPPNIGPDGLEFVTLRGGINPSDQRFHPALRQAMYNRNRSGYRVISTPVKKANTFNAWVTVWGEGQVRIRELALVVKNSIGQEVVIHSQRWHQNQPIAGGVYQHTSARWFARELQQGWDLPVFTRDRGDAIIDTRGKPDQAHHIWLTTWPHPQIPVDSQEVGVRAVFAAYDNALVHFGLDRYAHGNVTSPVQYGPQRNTWEVLHSQTYDASFNQVNLQNRTIYTPIIWED